MASSSELLDPVDAVRVPRSSPARGSLRELLSIAIPLVLSSGSITLMLTIDRLFLTWYSTDALAASAPSSALHWTLMSALVGTITYVNTFVAQYEGAGQRARVVESVWQATWIALGGGLLFLALAPWSPAIFRLAGHGAEVERLEAQFFRILCYGAVPMLLTLALACFYSGRGQTRIVMYVNFLLAATNIALDPLLIFGLGPFPRLGIAGAAIATDTAYTVAALTYFVLAVRRHDAAAYGYWRRIRPDRELFTRLLRYGLPSGLQMTAEVAAFSAFLILIGRIGKEQLAASNLAFNLNMLSFIPMLGVGTAVMTIVGKRIGEQRTDLAVRTTWLAAAVTACYMLLFCVLFIGLPDVIVRPFIAPSATPDRLAIRGDVVVLLRFVAFYTFFDGVVIVFASAVRGAGDTRFPFVYTLVMAWAVMVLPTYIAVETGRGGLFFAWSVCSAYICLLGVGMLARFLAGPWKSMSILESRDRVE